MRIPAARRCWWTTTLFGTDFLTAASTDISGAQQLSVAFGQVQQSHYSQSTTGAVQPPTQIGWDVVTNSADPGGIAAPPTGPVATASTPAPSVYYVRFVGADGTALSGDGGAQWFQLSDFAVGFSNSASIGSATGGAGAGKATFNPLSLKLPSNELPQLDNLLFTGGHLSQIEVAGYANSGGTQMLVDDYLFGTDFLTAASTDISGAQQLSVAFGQVQQSHYSQSTTGAVQPPTQIGWDVVTNSADPGGIAAPPTGPVATASTPAPSVYYVRFVGADGTALSGDGGAQWFQLSDFAVGFSNSASIGSATGGAGAGKATFNPLSLKLPSNELPQLDNLLFTGGHLSQIEVAGYANSGGTQMLVDDYSVRHRLFDRGVDRHQWRAATVGGLRASPAEPLQPVDDGRGAAADPDRLGRGDEQRRPGRYRRPANRAGCNGQHPGAVGLLCSLCRRRWHGVERRRRRAMVPVV